MRNVALSVLFFALLPGMVEAQRSRLSILPDSVYKCEDGSRRGTESWFFLLVVSSIGDADKVMPVEATSRMYRGAMLVETRAFSKDVLPYLAQKNLAITDETRPEELVNRYGRDELFDVVLTFDAIPIAWAIDRVEVTLVCEHADGLRDTLQRSVPVRTYAQRSELIFPFKGPGIISQGSINNGGHSGITNQYAIDALALSALYAPMVTPGDSSGSYTAWGHDVIAPGAGVVTYARNDVPDNVPDTDPSATTALQHDPLDATAGNAVMIDHGNGEYSVVMHMQQGSVRVRVGQRVAQGEPIGRIGNSGNSEQPHLHYQLQTGPTLFRDPSVPVRFSNVRGSLVRGNYFNAK
ncbi:MAG: M23 family metallopeptidase [Flavobacteriales bacterium]|nr:M23 family metallopeptidase [Flavobacteriales bacterium]MBP6698922.1 M23 family metallopeptidase [Flavobacteriales bacterium]